MIDGHHCYIAAASKVLPIISKLFMARATYEASSMNPHHHRPLLAVAQPGCPHINSQTVFALTSVIDSLQAVIHASNEQLLISKDASIAYLRRSRTEASAAANTLPAFGLYRRHEAINAL